MSKKHSPRSYRWPRNGDRLIRSSRYNKGITLPSDSSTRDAYIWHGFTRAAEMLIDQDGHPRQLLSYPILYCYRHGFEVAMKWILDNYGRQAGVTYKNRDHNLKKLWDACKKVIENLSDNDLDTIKAIKAMDKIADEFHKLDPGSFAFRYSTDKRLRTIELPSHAIDLGNLKDVMEAVDNFFVGVDGLLKDNCEYQCERMRRVWQRYLSWLLFIPVWCGCEHRRVWGEARQGSGQEVRSRDTVQGCAVARRGPQTREAQEPFAPFGVAFSLAATFFWRDKRK